MFHFFFVGINKTGHESSWDGGRSSLGVAVFGRKIAPFICEFSGVKDTCSMLPSTHSPQQSVWDILLDLKQPLSKKEVPDN